MSKVKKSRRTFLKLSAVTGVGLAIGIAVTRRGPGPIPYASGGGFTPNAFLQITESNEIHFYVPSSEMGQGVTTGLTTLVAEELKVSPESIIVHIAGAHEQYKNPLFGVQATGGSTSIRAFYQPVREAAAVAREAIVRAASQLIGAPENALQLQDAHILYEGVQHPYGQFVGLAASRELPESSPLTQAEHFRLIGKTSQRLDSVAKSTGTAEFGIDVEIPDLHKAVVVRCPVIGGSVKSCDTTSVAGMPGITHVEIIFNGVAVVSKDYWRAKKAAKALQIEWELPALADVSSDTLQAEFKAALDENAGEEAFVSGDGATALESADHIVEADYWAPYLAHATMEPMNCTAVVKGDHCEIWAPTQSPALTQGAAAFHTGIDKQDIKVHTTYLGGGFGRRANVDFVIEAVQTAKQTGVPVQVVWSREDDTKNDYYRPASYVRLQAGLDQQSDIIAWNARRAGPNIMAYAMEDTLDAMLPSIVPDAVVNWASNRGHGLYRGWKVDHSSVEGLYEDYDIPNKEVRHVTVDPGLRTGYWRSVGHSFSGFFKESFFDEVANAKGADPVQLRLTYAKSDPRLSGVIERVADEAGWGDSLPAGHFHGVAAHTSFQSAVAQVAEVSIDNNKIRVHKVTCVVDCGLAINPDIVRAQMEGGILFGITAALYGQIDLDNGAVRQGNFHDYPMLRMNEAPAIDVHIIASAAAPTGVGEPGLPPIAAAIGNAVFAATGKRLRHLPLKVT